MHFISVLQRVNLRSNELEMSADEAKCLGNGQTEHVESRYVTCPIRRLSGSVPSCLCLDTQRQAEADTAPLEVGIGTTASTSVPRKGEELTLIVPPTSRKRSRMLINPRPPSLPITKPRPWS